MSRSSFPRALAAALIFLVLVVLSLPLGMPSGGRYAGERQAVPLGDLEEKMKETAHFHRAVRPPGFPPPADSCGTCHPLPPHGEEGVTAALNNHHSSIFDCLVCHWSRRSGNRPDLVWGLRSQGEDVGVGAGGERLLLLLAAPPGGTTETTAALREKLLPTQKCFDPGLECRECHQSGGMAPYARPGMPEEVKARLEKLPDFFTLPSGSKWYFPQRL
jgi:hypothetical protein